MNANKTIKTMMLTGAIAIVLMGTGDLFARDRGDDGRSNWNDGQRGRVENVDRFHRDMNDREHFRPEFRQDDRPVFMPVRGQDRGGRFEPVRVITPCTPPMPCTPNLIHRNGLGININIIIGD